MGMRHRYFEESLLAVEQIRNAKNTDDLSSAFSKVLANLGYEYFCVVAAPARHRQAFSAKTLQKKWPAPWFEQYSKTDLHFHDPVSSYSRKQIHSFPWSVVHIPEDDRLAKDVMSISSHDYKMVHGFCVPIKGLHGHQATIFIAGRDVDKHRDANAAIDLLSIFAFNGLLNLKEDTNHQKLLTAREREVIAWAAAGKTAWDTSVILSIAVDTVNKTAASAMRELNVHTRAQAAAEAVRLGEIDL